MEENYSADGGSVDAPRVHSLAPTPMDLQAEMIAELARRQAKGDRIDGREVVALLDPGADNRQVREWLAQNRIMKGAEFDRALKHEWRRQKIKSRLGFVPETVVAFVKGYAERERISVPIVHQDADPNIRNRLPYKTQGNRSSFDRKPPQKPPKLAPLLHPLFFVGE